MRRNDQTYHSLEPRNDTDLNGSSNVREGFGVKSSELGDLLVDELKVDLSDGVLDDHLDFSRSRRSTRRGSVVRLVSSRSRRSSVVRVVVIVSS